MIIMKPSRFTLRQLDIFAAVMQTGQVRRAAETLHLSQAAVSQALRELAQALDVTLFTRDGRELRATASAHQLAALSHAPRRALADIAAQIQGDDSTELAGPIRIAASSSIARYLLPTALAGLLDAHPRLQITLIAGNSADVEERIAMGDVDIGFIEGPATRNDVVATAWRTDALTIIGPPDGPSELDPEALAGYPWIAREAGSGTRNVFEHSLGLAGYAAPTPRAIIDDSGAQIRAIAAGAGMACVSEAAASASIVAGNIQRVTLSGLTLARPLWRISRQHEPAAPLVERVVTQINTHLGPLS